MADEEFVVERVLDKRVGRSGKVIYRISHFLRILDTFDGYIKILDCRLSFNNSMIYVGGVSAEVARLWRR